MTNSTPPRATLSTHILNLDVGSRVEGMQVELRAAHPDGTASGALATAATDADGRIADWPALEPGCYELSFAVGDWFSARDQTCFYPRIRIEFNIDEQRHYHVPLLLNRFGFSSYRGS